MTAHIEYDEISGAYLPKRDTCNAAIGFLDDLGDLAVFTAAAVPHSRRA